jgi:hypothetical protein
MAISRAQLVIRARAGPQCSCLVWSTKTTRTSMFRFMQLKASDRAFEEEVMESGFGEAPVKI